MPLRNQVELTFAEDISPPRAVLPAASFSAERVPLAPARFEYATTGNTHYLALHDIVMRDGEIRVDGAASIRQADLRRKITFLPAGVAVAGWTDPIERPNSFLAIHFDVAAIPEPLRDSANFQAPAVYFEDARLCATLAKLDRAMTRDEPYLGLLSETLCDLAIIEFGLRQTKSFGIARRAPALPASRIALVREFIAANLTSSVSLSDLSNITGLSKFHFSRAFKAATGRSPYREVLMTRLAVARRLLSEGSSLGEAAALTGFTRAAQLARSLRQHPGNESDAG